MKIPLVNLRRQYKTLQPEIDASVQKVLSQGNFILGVEVEEFEKAFSRYCGVKYCVGVASGSDAILLALRALGVGSGDEVITVSNTFISTLLPVLALGAKPVLVEINPDTYQMDAQKLEGAITKKTKGIIPVHLFGIPCEMNKILKIARKNKIFVMEDACQAHGSTYQGRKCGSFGQASAFSFYPGKNLGAAGDGGAVVTNNKTLAEKVRVMRNIGQTEKYKHDVFGYNSRLDTIHAAVLSVKLRHLDAWNARRRKAAALYNRLLADLPIVLPPTLGRDYKQNYHLYAIRVKRRDELFAFLQKNGVGTGIHYPIAVHLQKAARDLGYKKGDFPVTELYAKELLSLPIFPEIEEKEVRKISDLIHKFIKRREART